MAPVVTINGPTDPITTCVAISLNFGLTENDGNRKLSNINWSIKWSAQLP